MRIGVGSRNPAKIEAVKLAITKIFGELVEIIPVEVRDAPKQPLSENEMIEGAIHRAKVAFTTTKADFGIGLEGGLIKNAYGVFVKGWVAVYDGNDIGLASTVAVQLPNYVWEYLVKGTFSELEEIMVKISGIDNIASSIGAIGYMTRNYYDRIKAFRDAIFCAFSKFFRKEIFDNPKI